MKKSSLILCTSLALSGCMFGFDPDVDSAAETRAEHHDSYRQEFGCPLSDDHEAYRTCILNTYRATHPKTYKVEQAENGKSVAIVKNETKTSYDKDTDTYKTERVIVIETEERLVPVPLQPGAPSEVTPSEVTPIEPTPINLNALNSPASDVAITNEVVAVSQENTPQQTSEKPATKVQPTEPKPTTWWDTYQQKKGKTPTAQKPICPCPDPNEPCPQCVDK
ncbi:MAG: hypothetical protein SPL08_03950 [Pseudomonadota bacterium]|nr:hypothetical protein [Pseudomonadota bacterium]